MKISRGIKFLAAAALGFFVATLFPGLSVNSVSADQDIVVICKQGYLSGPVPAAEVPTYSYGPDGFVQFHFKFTGVWNNSLNYNFYDENCVFQGRFNYGTPKPNYTPGEMNVVAKVEDLGGGWYNFRFYNEDTGEDVTDIIGNRPQAFKDRKAVSLLFIESWGSPGFPNYREYSISTPVAPLINPNYSPKKDPVIIIPGIVGSWNVPLSGWQLDPITHIYDDLWAGLIEAGYEEGKDLFAFPYQWRVSNELTAYDLMRKIDEVQQISGADKVDLIAHSMGGLVARYYVQNELFLEDSDGNSEVDVDQIIFLGTPHKGATKSYLTWEAGEIGPGFRDWIAERIFTVQALEEGFLGVFDYVRNLPMPSVQELLPIYDYLKEKDSGVIRQYPNNYPVNSFLEELNKSAKLEKMNQVRGLNIIGKTGPGSTIDVIRVENKNDPDGKWEHGYPEGYGSIFGDKGLEKGEGDITVPNRSNNEFLNWQTIILPFEHKDLTTESQKIVIKELTGVEPAEIIRKNFFTKWLFIKVHSPVDFNVMAPDGRKIGKEFSNGGIVNEISGAFYSGFEGPEFVLIPNPLNGSYQVELEGTGQGGSFELIISSFNEETGQSSDNSTFGVVGGGEELSYEMEYDVNLEEPIEIIREGGEITIDKVIENVRMLVNDGKFKNKLSPKTLIMQLKLMKRWDSKMEQTDKARKKKFYRGLILSSLNFMEKRLNRMLKKDRVEPEAHEFLIEDINLLKINYE